MEDDAECSAAEEVSSRADLVSGSPAMEPRQGDYLPDIRNLPILDAEGEVHLVSAPEGAVVITQCCDLARGGNGHAHLSPVTVLSGDKAAFARSGRIPRFVPIPELGPNRFVDLGTACSAKNELLGKTTRTEAIVDDQSRHKFGQRIGRRFSRFALPDELNPMLQPLKELVRKKAGKSSSPFGQVLDHLATVRLGVEGGWGSAPPWELTLLLVLEDGRLPTLATTPANSTQRTSQDVTESAKTILELNEGDPRLWDSWQSLADALVDDMRKERPPTVVDIQAEVLDENDLTWARYRRTVGVDLEDLSEPVDDGS